jgi:RNA polymerase sigma factor (sigma-70 family)
VRSPSDALALFNANLNLAHWYAHRYRDLEEHDDLFQAASLGLWIACQDWNPAIAKLSVHAKTHMRSAIQEYLRRAGRLYGSGSLKVRPPCASLSEFTEEIDDNGRNHFAHNKHQRHR